MFNCQTGSGFKLFLKNCADRIGLVCFRAFRGCLIRFGSLLGCLGPRLGSTWAALGRCLGAVFGSVREATLDED